MVDPETFHVERLKAGLTRKAAAVLLCVSERSVRNWEAGRAKIPYSAFRLLCIEGGYELPGEHWRGFLLRGDTIWSPEGKAFSSHDLAWWSLTCELARERRELALRQAVSNQPVAEAPAVRLRAADRREVSAVPVRTDCPSLQNRPAANQDRFDDAPPSPYRDLPMVREDCHELA